MSFSRRPLKPELPEREDRGTGCAGLPQRVRQGVGAVPHGLIRIALALALLCSATALPAQDDVRVEMLTAVLEYALDDQLPRGAPRSTVLLDTLRTGGGPDSARVAARVAAELGLLAGVSEDHCRRYRLDPARHSTFAGRVGVEVQGVAAILTASFETFTPDSAEIWVPLARGRGPHLDGPRSYIVRRVGNGWEVEPDMAWSGGYCAPPLYPTAFAMAGEALLDELDPNGPVCLDPTGVRLLEQDSVVALLDAEVRGQWVPPLEWGEPVPEPYRDPCGKADREWGAVVRVVDIDWVDDDLLRVTWEGRTSARADQGATRQVRYTLREEDGRWLITEAVSPSPPPGTRP